MNMRSKVVVVLTSNTANVSQPLRFKRDPELENAWIIGFRVLTNDEYKVDATKYRRLPSSAGTALAAITMDFYDRHQRRLTSDTPVETFVVLTTNQRRYYCDVEWEGLNLDASTVNSNTSTASDLQYSFAFEVHYIPFEDTAEDR